MPRSGATNSTPGPLIHAVSGWRVGIVFGLRRLLLLGWSEQTMPAARMIGQIGPLQFFHGLADVGELCFGVQGLELAHG